MGRYSDYQKSDYLRRSGFDGRIRGAAGIKIDDKLNIPVIAEGPYEGVPAFADYKSFFSEYFNDFLRYPDYDATNEWTLSQENGNTSATVTLSDDASYGYLSLNVISATDNHGLNIQFTAANGAGEFVLPAANKLTIYEVRVQVDDATDCDFFAGLSITDTDLAAASGAFIDASDYVGFEKDDGDANVDFVSAENSIETKELAITTVADATWKTLAFRADGVSSIQAWYKDSSDIWQRGGAPITTNINDDERMCLTFGLCNGAAAAKRMFIDYVRVLLQR